MDCVLVRLLSAPDEGLRPSLQLAATLYLPPRRLPGAPPGGVPGLVVGHGAGSRGSRHEDFCVEACQLGFAVLALDFRGHGDSHGSGDGPMEQDVLAAVRFLRRHPAVDARHVCYRGSSLGAFYGLKAAPQAGFTAMVLLCPASEDAILDALEMEHDLAARGDTEAPDNAGDRLDATVPAHAGAPPVAPQTRWDKPRFRAYFERQDSRDLAARVECPVLLVHARPDEQVPFAHTLLLAEHLRTDTTLLALEQGSHGTVQHDPAVHAYSVAWLRDQVAKARALGDVRNPRG